MDKPGTEIKRVLSGIRVVEGKLFSLTELRRRLIQDDYYVGKETLSRIFRGINGPSLPLLKAIAKVLKMGLDDTVALIDLCASDTRLSSDRKKHIEKVPRGAKVKPRRPMQSKPVE